MTDVGAPLDPPTARSHPAYDLKTVELRALCRRYGIAPRGGLSRAGRDDLLTWVIVNGLIERRDARKSDRPT